MARLWKQSNDIDILKKLGIIDKGKANRSLEDDEEEDDEFGSMVTASEGETVEESEEDDADVIFDRDRLLPHADSSFSYPLQLRNRKMNADSRITVIFRGILVCAAFFTLGLCLSIVGPTLPDLQARTNSSSLRAVVAVISANSFGSILGVAFGGSVYGCVNAFCVMAVILFLCAGATLIIPWCTTLTGVTIICLFQGITLGFLERGGYSMFYAYWKKKYRVLHLFYFSLALGACISPLVTTPFVFSHFPFPNLNGTSVPYTVNGYEQEASTHSRRKFDPTNLLRNKRENFAETGILTTLASNASSSSSVGNNDLTASTRATSPVPVKPKHSENVKDSSQPNTKKKVEEIKADAIAKTKEETAAKKTAVNEPPPQLFTKQDSNHSSTTPSNNSGTQDTVTQTKIPAQSKSTSTGLSTGTTVKVSSSSLKTATTSNQLTSSQSSNPITTSAATSRMTTGPETKETTTSTDYTDLTTETNAGIITEALWDLVLSRVSEINRVHFAYLVIAVMSIVSTLGFSLMCCCMPCKSFRLPPENKADYRFTPRSLCASRHNTYSILLTIVLAFLVVGMESVIYNLLTIYVIWDHKKVQAKGVLLTTLYWLTVSVGRLFLAIFNRLVNYRLMLLVCFAITLLVTACLSVFAWSWTVVCMGVAALGFTIGPIFPLMYSYLDHSLGFSPWISSIWLVAAQLGRMTIPVVTMTAVENRQAPRDVLFSLLVCSLLSGVLFIFAQRTVKAASQLMAVDAFTRQIRQANGDVAEYRRMPEDTEGSVHMDKLDDYLFDGETIHFDRSREAKFDRSDGIFAQYSNGRTISNA